jgi:hypothetical protein
MTKAANWRIRYGDGVSDARGLRHPRRDGPSIVLSLAGPHPISGFRGSPTQGAVALLEFC